MTAGPTVLVMADGPADAGSRSELVSVLGAERTARLDTILLAEAVRWARALGDGTVRVAEDTGDGIAARVERAAADAFAQGAESLVVLWPEVPLLRPAHARAVLEELASDGGLLLGPMIDGGAYLLGVAHPFDGLGAIAEAVWDGGDAVPSALGTVQAAGLELGLLRTERGLRLPSDVEAALADPCLPAELRSVLAS